jgi:hypothetical protein
VIQALAVLFVIAIGFAERVRITRREETPMMGEEAAHGPS